MDSCGHERCYSCIGNNKKCLLCKEMGESQSGSRLTLTGPRTVKVSTRVKPQLRSPVRSLLSLRTRGDGAWRSLRGRDWTPS